MSAMVWLTVIAFVLTVAAAFVGFRELLPGVLTVLVKVLFVLFLVTGIVGLNVLILRPPSGKRHDTNSEPPEPGQ